MPTLIISDFSKTFTAPACPTTWSVFAKSGLLGEQYTADRNRLYDENYHFEVEGNVKETQRWFHDHLELFAKYGVTQDHINKIVMDDTYFMPREGIEAFLWYVRENKIPLQIVTSGIVDFVEAFFIERGYGLDGIEIYGNKLIFDENGTVVGVDRSVGIVPIDKSNHPFEYADADEVWTIGDNREDNTMAQGPNVKSFGFTDDDRWFDVNLGKDGSFEDLLAKAV